MPLQQQWWPWWLGGRQRKKWTMEAGGLGLPLLNPGNESVSASARAEAQVAWQQAQYTAGLVLLSGAFLIDGGDDYWRGHENPDYKKGYNGHDMKIWGGIFMVFGLTQTIGLMLMATSTADTNLHVKQHRMLAGFVAVAIVVYSGLELMRGGTKKVALVSKDRGFA